MKKLFIGKLSRSTDEASLRALFASYEPLNSVRVMKDKFTGEARGFAFVEIANDQSADEAISALNGASLDGHSIVVNEARPQSDAPRSFDRRPSFRDSQGSRRGNYRSSGSNRY